jgi:hypothetical protein
VAILGQFSGNRDHISQSNRDNNDSDDELEALDTEIDEIPIDPFGKVPIRIPVRNKKCHHVYDKHQLEQVIAAKKGYGVRFVVICLPFICIIKNKLIYFFN